MIETSDFMMSSPLLYSPQRKTRGIALSLQRRAGYWRLPRLPCPLIFNASLAVGDFQVLKGWVLPSDGEKGHPHPAFDFIHIFVKLLYAQGPTVLDA
jgi:hypothetical protein